MGLTVIQARVFGGGMNEIAGFIRGGSGSADGSGGEKGVKSSPSGMSGERAVVYFRSGERFSGGYSRAQDMADRQRGVLRGRIDSLFRSSGSDELRIGICSLPCGAVSSSRGI